MGFHTGTLALISNTITIYAKCRRLRLLQQALNIAAILFWLQRVCLLNLHINIKESIYSLEKDREEGKEEYEEDAIM